MAFVKKTDTKSQVVPIDTKRIFIGRSNEVDFFKNDILRPEDPLHNIVSISGDGGVGKSTLLEKLIEETRTSEFKDYCLVAKVDEWQSDAASVMEAFAEQIGHKDHPLETSKKNLIEYKDALLKIQTDRDNKRDSLAQDTMEMFGSIAGGTPVMGKRQSRVLKPLLLLS